MSATLEIYENSITHQHCRYGYIQSKAMDGKFCWTVKLKTCKSGDCKGANNANLVLKKCEGWFKQRFMIINDRFWLLHRSDRGQQFCVVYNGYSLKLKTRKCYAGFSEKSQYKNAPDGSFYNFYNF